MYGQTVFAQGERVAQIASEWEDVFVVLGNVGQVVGGIAAAIALFFAALTLRTEGVRRREDEERRREDEERRVEGEARAEERRREGEARAEELRREDEERAGLVHSVDLLMRLDERFNSDRGLQIRCAAAKALSDMSRNGSKLQDLRPEMVELVDVLNFFEMIGLLHREGALKIEHVRHKFGAKLRVYYFACEEAIKNRRQEDAWYYDDLENLHDQITDLQGRWYDDHDKPRPEITDGILKGFLEKEIQRGRHQ